MVTAADPKALVLSGGGTRGAFEAGAIDLLVTQGMPCPEIITGTSAGSISAGVLAQARGETELAECAQTLKADILAMTEIDKVFAKTDWAKQLDGTPVGQLIDTLIGRGRPPVPVDPTLADDPLAPFADGSGHKSSWKDLAGTMLHPGAVHRATKDFWNDPASLMTLDPLEAALRGYGEAGISKVDEDRIARPGLTLRLTVSALQAGVPRYITESGTMVDSDAVTPYPSGGTPGVISGMLASSSVPVLFSPRLMGDDAYVDGGVLRNLPLEAAVFVGAGDVTAILANVTTAEPMKGPLDKLTLLEVYSRYGEIELFDQVVRSLTYPLKEGAALTAVTPSMNVVAPFEVQQGLLLIDMDYGWMRAAEATDLDASCQRIAQGMSDALTVGRIRAWYLEEMVIEADVAGQEPAEDVAVALRSAKSTVATQLASWRQWGLPTPSGADAWATSAETHNRPLPDGWEKSLLG